MPALILFALFVGVPIVEIGLFIQVGGFIGLWPTLFIVIATALAGTALLRAQGFGVMARAQEALNRGEVPVDQAIHGVFLLVAGLLLLTPGFMTDAFGFALFVPPVRLALGRFIWQAIQNSPNFQVHTTMETHSAQSWHAQPFQEEDEPFRPDLTPGTPNPDSPWGGGTQGSGHAADNVVDITPLRPGSANDSDTSNTTRGDKE